LRHIPPFTDLNERRGSKGIIPGIKTCKAGKPDHFLLKTFSINPFQGQYPTTAVNTKRAPTTMERGFQNPGRKRPKTERIPPPTARRIPSLLPTFVVMPISSS
jgi:hypothetical protein